MSEVTDLRPGHGDDRSDRRACFFERMPGAVVVCDADGDTLDCNDAATRILEVERVALLGRSPFDHRAEVLDEDGSEIDPDELPPRRVLRTRAAVEDVEICRRSDAGTTRWLRLTTHLVDADDPRSEVITTFWDVTRTRRRRRAFQALRSTQEVVVRATDTRELLDQACRAIVDTGGYALAWIGEAMADVHRTVAIRAAAGATSYLHPDFVSWHSTRPDGRGPVGTALRGERPVLVDDVATDPSFHPWAAGASEHGFGSVLTVPFTDRRRRMVLAIYADEPHAFDTGAVDIFTSLAADLSHAVRHVDHVALLSGSLDATIDAIATMIEARDPYTSGHQHRVAQLATAIARDLEVDPVTIDELYLGALVHDIGKISLPAEILSKPSRLDIAEFELVKRHSAKGADILGHGRMPRTVVEIAAQHHERLDGSGYPHGLRGDEISLPARIVAVADVVEAIAHHRPYRAALGLDDAITEIRSGSGTLYDADAVASCLRVLEGGFRFSDESIA